MSIEKLEPIKTEFLDGKILLIDKPLGWTSFDAVNKIRWLLKRILKLKKIKVGHTGTLDPLATGLLVICTGRATKQINELTGLEKEYTGTLKLGVTTPSFDGETEENTFFETGHISKELIYESAKQFTGEIDQKPPVFSAVKKDGKRLYEHARKGEKVEIPSRRVHIHEFDITKIEMPFADFRVVCSKGTYIRSLADDFGKALGSGAYLTALRRTKIGAFEIENAITVEDFERQFEGMR